MSTYDELFTRGISSFIDPDNVFQKKVEALKSGASKEPVIIKFGVDPTRPDLHLGHAVVLRKLRAFQDIGCKVIFLVGDYTSQIGDPTGKSKVRPEISQAEIEANMKTYLDQVGKILSLDPAVFSWMRNSDWFTSVTDIVPGPESKVEVTITSESGVEQKIPINPNSFEGKAVLYENTRMQKTHLNNEQIRSFSLGNILSVLRHITHARLIERDMFKNRIESGQELYMHEMMYPVLQGIDSSVLADIYGSCDLEIGGSDQTFNMLMGRDVMRMNKQPEQSVLSLDILEGLDGKEKMSKSLDNYVSITDEPNDMYGKIMSVPDAVVIRYFTLATYTSLSEIKELEAGDVHPKELKMRLAREIVAIYHGEGAADTAEDAFTNTFSEGKIPEDVKELSAEGTILETLMAAGCAESKTEARRLVDQGAVTFLDTDTKITEQSYVPEKGTYRVGKHRFFKIV